MLTRIDLRGRVPSPVELRASLPRAEVDVDAVLHQVRPVVDAVRERGVDAVLEYTERFDKVRPAHVRVPAAELARAADEVLPGPVSRRTWCTARLSALRASRGVAPQGAPRSEAAKVGEATCWHPTVVRQSVEASIAETRLNMSRMATP